MNYFKKIVEAVDAAADTITITAHGLTTGDTFLAVYTPDGVLPDGLEAVTDYWAIRVDPDTLKLANSSANAMAGTAVDIIDDGSGTLYLLGGAPYRRNATHEDGVSQIKAATLNDLEDSGIALWNFLTGQAQSIYDRIKLAADQDIELQGAGTYKHGTRTLQVPGASFVSSSGGAVAYSSNNGVAGAPAPLNAWAPIVLPQGARILEVRLFVKDNATGPTKLQFQVWDTSSAGVGVQVGADSNESDGSGAGQTLSVAGLTQVVASGHAYAIALNTTTGTDAVNSPAAH